MTETLSKESSFHSIALLEQGDHEAAQVMWQHSLCLLVGLARPAGQPGGPS
jgi:hypothetical protein